MRAFLVSLLMTCSLFCGVATAQVTDPNSGLTGWALMGITPELSKLQEIRVGYEFGARGALSGIEFAGGILHLDGPDAGLEEWAGRLYVLAHALDTRMFTQFLGSNFTLPNGNLYGGLFGQYATETARNERLSGGWLIGGLVDFPGKWQTVAEYQSDIWNTDRNVYVFVMGLRRKF